MTNPFEKVKNIQSNLVHHEHFIQRLIWVKVFKSRPSKICGRQSLKNLKGCGIGIPALGIPYPLNSFQNPIEPYQAIMVAFLSKAVNNFRTRFHHRCLTWYSSRTFFYDTQEEFACSKLTIGILEKVVKYVQS